MPKLTGPLLSISARGTFADQLTFRRHPSGTILTSRPGTPRSWSNLQLAYRHKMSQLSAHWLALTNEQKATWDAPATANKSTRWAEYTRVNGPRLGTTLPIIDTWPPTETPPGPSITLTVTPDQEVTTPLAIGDYADYDQVNGVPAFYRVTAPTFWVFYFPENGCNVIADSLDLEQANTIYLSGTPGMDPPAGTFFAAIGDLFDCFVQTL